MRKKLITVEIYENTELEINVKKECMTDRADKLMHDIMNIVGE